MLVLDGENIILKEFSRDNLYDQNYFKWLRDLEIVTNFYRQEYLKPMDFKRVEEYVNTVQNSGKDCFFAIYYRSSNQFIGTFKIGNINWRSGVAEAGIMIGDKEYWGRGLGSEVLQLGVKYAFTTLCLRKITGGTLESNIGMRRCFEKTGFVQEATKRKELLVNGKYIDHILYGLLKEDTDYA